MAKKSVEHLLQADDPYKSDIERDSVLDDVSRSNATNNARFSTDKTETVTKVNISDDYYDDRA